MGVIIQNELLSAAEQGSVFDLDNARICSHTFTADEANTLDASSSTDAAPVLNLRHPMTYEWWSPSTHPSSSDQWVRVQLPEADLASYAAIGAHNLGDVGAQVSLQRWVGSSWETVVGPVTPSNNSPILMLFTSLEAQQWRFLLSGGDNSVLPRVAVFYVGRSLDMPRPILGGHVPPDLADRLEASPTDSEEGQWLGINVVRRAKNMSVDFENIRYTWVDENMRDFLEASHLPYFFAFRPLSYPKSVMLGRTAERIRPSFIGRQNTMSIAWTIEGLGDD